MKIKSEIVVSLSLTLGLSLTQGFAAKPKNNNKHTTELSIEKSFDYDKFFEHETPLKFSLRTLQWYKQSLQSTMPTRSLSTLHKREEPASRAAFFNQVCIKYIKDVYNNRSFNQALSQDGSHVIAFLELADELSLDVNTTYVGMRLFYNKIKACEVVDDTVFHQVLPAFKVFSRFFNSDEEHTKKMNLNFIKDATERIMLKKFTESFDSFEHDPGNFLENLSENLAKKIGNSFKKVEDSMKKNFEKQLLHERLRQLIIKFSEITLNKLMWSTRSYEGVWTSFISLAHELQMLGQNEIIDYMDDLDDLLWSLIHRFCWFLDFTGSVFPLTFYQEIESDLSKGLIYFLEIPEQDEEIKSKKETLLDALIVAKTKAIAFEKGIISQAM